MRINVWAAIGLGILLPTLETLRRGFGHWSVSFTTMFEDYLAGVGLLVAAIGAMKEARWAPDALIVMWSGTSFMLLISTVSQIEREFWSGDPEPRGAIVLAAKVMLLAIAAIALAQSFRDSRLSGNRM